MTNNFCLYFHINPIKQEVFNVGIGNVKRPYSKNNRNKWWHNISNKYGYNVIVIHENLKSEEAKKLEIKYIKQIGRRDLKLGTLVNLTDGGDGNFNPSPSVRLKNSENKMGNKNPMFGKKLSVDHKLKISNSSKGKKLSEETKKKLSKPKKNTDKYKNCQLGKIISEETKHKISEKLMGRKLSINHRNKISESMRKLKSIDDEETA